MVSGKLAQSSGETVASAARANILILDLDAKSMLTTIFACTFLSLCYNSITSDCNTELG